MDNNTIDDIDYGVCVCPTMTDAINECVVCYLCKEEKEYNSNKQDFDKPLGWYFWQDEMGIPLLNRIMFCPWCSKDMRPEPE